MYVVYDGAREKTDSVIQLFFVCCLSWRKRKNFFCYNIIFSMVSMIKQENKFFLLPYYFLYVGYDEEREKTHFVITLVYVCCLWWRNKKDSFSYNIIRCRMSDGAKEKTPSVITIVFVCFLWWRTRKNSFCWNIPFCILCMMEQEKEFILL